MIFLLQFIVSLCYDAFFLAYVVYFIRLWHDIAYLCWKCR